MATQASDGMPSASSAPGASARRRGGRGARLRDADAGVRFQASTALGRIGDAAAIPALIEALVDEDAIREVRRFHRLEPDRAGQPRLPGGRSSAGSRTPGRSSATGSGWHCARRTSRRSWWRWRISRGIAAPAEAKAQALRLLAAVHRRRPAWKGEWWAYHPALSTPPAKTENWEGTPTVLAALRGGIADADPGVRLAAVEGLREAGAADVAPVLRARFLDEPDPGVRLALLSALGTFRDERRTGADRRSHP